MIALRLFFALLLLATGGTKLLDIPGFAAVIDSYVLLPAALAVPSAWALAVAEIALGLWLLSARRIAVAAVVVAALHLSYLLWLLIALIRGLSLPNCGCFGVYWPRPLTWLSPLEDLALLMLAIILWRMSSRRIAQRKH
jgi:hypothetical protein